MTRAAGLDLVRKYDDEFPASNLRANLEYLGLTEAELTELVDLHRNREIWAFGECWSCCR